MMDFIYHYQTLLSASFLILAGYLAYLQNRKLRLKELEDNALSTAINVQIQIEHLTFYFMLLAANLITLFEIAEKSHKRARVILVKSIVFFTDQLEKNVANNCYSLGELTFLKLDLTIIAEFFLQVKNLISITHAFKYNWTPGNIEEKELTEEDFLQTLERYQNDLTNTVNAASDAAKMLQETTNKPLSCGHWIASTIADLEKTNVTLKKMLKGFKKKKIKKVK